MSADTITFAVPGLPVAKGRPRFARSGHAYTPKRTRQAEETFAARAWPYRPVEPLGCPLRILVVCTLPIPKSWPNWQKTAALTGHYMHVGRPDADNLLKLVKDALSGLFWIDDSQIVCAKVVKKYGPLPQTAIEIIPLHQAIKPENPRRFARRMSESEVPF